MNKRHNQKSNFNKFDKTDEVWPAEGSALYRAENYLEAFLAFDRAIQTNPSHLGALTGKGFALIKLKRYEEAISIFEQAIHLNSGSAQAHYGKGNALASLKRYEEALISFETALEVLPGFTAAYLGKRRVLTIIDAHNRIISTYKNYLELNDFSWAYTRGEVFFYTSYDYEEKASIFYEEAIRNIPNDADIYNDKGLLFG